MAGLLWSRNCGGAEVLGALRCCPLSSGGFIPGLAQPGPQEPGGQQRRSRPPEPWGTGRSSLWLQFQEGRVVWGVEWVHPRLGIQVSCEGERASHGSGVGWGHWDERHAHLDTLLKPPDGTRRKFLMEPGAPSPRKLPPRGMGEKEGCAEGCSPLCLDSLSHCDSGFRS